MVYQSATAAQSRISRIMYRGRSFRDGWFRQFFLVFNKY